jgi:hypothetical protein
MLLARLTDTTAHGVVYETRGSVDHEVLERGAALVSAFAQRTRAQWRALDAEPGEPQRWLEKAIERVAEVLGPPLDHSSL